MADNPFGGLGLSQMGKDFSTGGGETLAKLGIAPPLQLLAGTILNSISGGDSEWGKKLLTPSATVGVAPVTANVVKQPNTSTLPAVDPFSNATVTTSPVTQSTIAPHPLDAWSQINKVQ
jgi:hypothetical protein